MSKLLLIRQKLNITQEALSEKSGISVRTIQRIEAGTSPKGYTLKALALALEINESELLDNSETIPEHDITWLKIINLSSLLFVLLPPLNIAVPLLIMYIKKQFTPLTRQMVSIQIIMTLLAILLLLIVVILNDWFEVRSQYTLLIPLAWVLLNTVIILRNAIEIDKKNALRIYLNFNIV
ncbi:helix-turn-helix domain-containing protein [Confluentibacter lentus]|uniref:helix-turn-helix domain-containing protein n=1 Tax=Confluentibacter lentus TaxID=1699412 RepID=UPI000C287884|nr:helix-turn-helix transcriptional regulator [Confluentibacter lentus]